MKIFAAILSIALILCVAAPAPAMYVEGETVVTTYEPMGGNPLAPKIETITVVSPPDVPVCGASRCKGGRLSASASCDASVSQ